MSKSIVPAEKSASLSALAKAVTENAGGATRQAAVIAAASGLVLSGGLAVQAASTPEVAPAVHSAPVVASPAPTAAAEVKAPAKAKAKKVERAAVKAKSAPKRAAAKKTTAPAAAAAPKAAAPAATQAPVQAAAPAATQAPVATPVAAAAPAAAPAVSTASASGKGAVIAAAARAQVGAGQDCTMLVTNALAAAGVSHHGWPASYMGLGTIVSTPQPGDLIYYDNAGAGIPHIAVYIGNGQAVHGGWAGNQTVVASAYLGSGPVFIRVA